MCTRFATSPPNGGQQQDVLTRLFVSECHFTDPIEQVGSQVCCCNKAPGRLADQSLPKLQKTLPLC
jgi:hypothetical protein